MVGDVEQSVDRLHRDGLTGQVTADVVAMLQDADASGVAHPPADGVPGS